MGRQATRVAAPETDRGDPAPAPQSSPPTQILQLQALAGNRAVTAMLQRCKTGQDADTPKPWKVTAVVTDDYYGGGVMADFDGVLEGVVHGAAFDVINPLDRSNGYVRACQGARKCWISVTNLRTDDADGALGVAIAQSLRDEMLAVVKPQALPSLLTSMKRLGSVDMKTVGAILAEAETAVVQLDNARNDLRRQAEERGVRLLVPDVVGRAEAAARGLMEKSGFAAAMQALYGVGANPAGLAGYRRLRDLLEYPLFKGLAAEQGAVQWFDHYENGVKQALEHAELDTEPTPKAPGVEQLEHWEPTIDPRNAYRTVETRTAKGPKSGHPTGGSVGEPVIAQRNPWAAEVTAVSHVRENRPGLASLYIDDQPRADDVKQTGLGDCYYLALVIAVAERDPARIKRLLPDTDGSTFSVTFHYKPSRHSTTFLPRTVKLPITLAYTVNIDNQDLLVGSHFRIAPTGLSRWTRYDDGETESVHEERLYKTALWAPLMEKAYARLAQEHGMYGELFGQDKSGYELIGDRGGSSQLVAGVLYGDDIVRRQELDPGQMRAGRPGLETPGVELVAALARLDVASDGRTSLLTAGADDRDQAERARKLAMELVEEGTLPAPVIAELTTLCDAWTADAVTDEYRDAAKALTDPLRFLAGGEIGSARDAIRRQVELIAGIKPGDELTAVRDRLAPGRAALSDTAVLTGTGIFPDEIDALRMTLDDVMDKGTDDAQYRRPKLVNIAKGLLAKMGTGAAVTAHATLKADPRGAALLELALSLRNEGDTGGTQRFVYSSHAYAVLGVIFRNDQGFPLQVTPEAAPEFMAQIDADQSRVRMRNPHHEGSPDQHGTRREDTGEFWISLAQFTRQFANLREALVKKAS